MTLREHRLDSGKATAHINGAQVYGGLGGKTTLTLAIDQDLHRGDVSIFLDQFQILASELPPDWHWQVANEFVNGVHHWCVLDGIYRLSEARNQLRDWLNDLDRRYPKLARAALAAKMKPFGKMEIYPDPSHGFRLPLCHGRTMLLDHPLGLIENRRTTRKWVQDVVGYFRFVDDPSRHRMPVEEAVKFLKERLPLPVPQVTTLACPPLAPLPSSSRSKPTPQQQAATPGSATASKGRVLIPAGVMKGCFVRKFVEFWTGTNQVPDELNTWIVMTARYLRFEVVEDQAVQIIEKFVDDLPSVSFSDRLSSGNRKEVSRVVRSTVKRVFVRHPRC
ncbi:MAG: hypothetical protein CMJ48_13315 [Planctomycetaceae bacterium]|nr:hypothetical protein [Planctomycetaceae bacterium]